MTQAVGPPAVALLLVLTGCAGFGGPTTSTTAATATTTAATTTTTTAPTTTVPDSAVVSYEELSERGKRIVTRLLDAGSLTVPAHEIPSALRPGSGYEYVRYREMLYALSREGVHLVRRALSVRQINDSQAGSERIRQYRNLSTDEQATFDTVRTAPNLTRYYPPENVSFALGTHVVEDDGTLYELTVYHADFQGVRFSLQKASTD